MTTVAVPPKLAHAVCEALNIFRRHLPLRIWTELDRDDADRDKLIAEWARPLGEVSPEAIPDAAQRWVGDPGKVIVRLGEQRMQIPSPGTFAMYARTVDVAHYRAAGVEHQPSLTLVDDGLNTLYRRARQVLAPDHVSRVWALLLRFAETPAARQEIRNGMVTLERFDEAVEMVRREVAAEPAAKARHHWRGTA